MPINKPMFKLVMDLLEAQIPNTYFYHNVEHTLNVMEHAEEIGKQENCSPQDLELLEVAALWHDTGYVKIYDGHEEESCILVKQNLPAYGYSLPDVEKICGMIRATKIPQTPHNKLEQIIADADLAYLGTDKASKLADNLFRELHSLHPLLTKEAWRKTEINFLKNHQFFTNYCKEKQQPGKLQYLKTLLAAENNSK